MKKSILSFVAAGLVFVSCGENTTKEAIETVDSTEVLAEDTIEEESAELAFNGVQKGEFTLYGHEDVEADGAVSQAEMFKTFKETGSFSGKVKVQINEVCQKAGCWINFKKNENENVMVFFRDHFTIPIEESAGKTAILYGQLETDTLSIDFQKHLLDDAAEAGEVINQEDYDAITAEKIDVSFDCVSVLLR